MAELTPEEKTMVEMGLMDKPVETTETTEKIVEEKPIEKTETTETKETTTTEEPVYDYEKITGRVKSKEELDGIFTEYDTIKKDYEPIKKRASELEQQVKTLKETNPFGENDTLWKMHKLAEETKRSDYDFLYKVISSDFTKMNDFEVLKLKELYSNSDIYKGREGMLDRSLAKSYDISKPTDEEYDAMSDAEKAEVDDRVALNEIKMAKDAKQARAEFEELKSKYKYEKPDEAAIEQQRTKEAEDLVKSWIPTLKHDSENLKVFSVTTEDGTIDIPIRDEDKAIIEQVFNGLSNHIIMNNIKCDKDGLKSKDEFIQNSLWLLNREFITKKLIEAGANKESNLWSKRVHNPKPINTETKQTEVTKTPEEETLEKMQKENIKH